mgnify:CR=1 FL=1
MPKFFRYGSVLVLVFGLATGVGLVQQKQNIFGKAWSGIVTNTDKLQQLFLGPQSAVTNLPTEVASKKLFYDLLATYPNSEVATLSAQALGVSGNAYLIYVPEVQKTFVFSKIEGLPSPKTKVIRLWISSDNINYKPVGTPEFVNENQTNVGYSVFVEPGDLHLQKNLVFSYDTNTQVKSPELIVFDLKF